MYLCRNYSLFYVVFNLTADIALSCQCVELICLRCDICVLYAACEPELMPSFPRYRNMKRKSSASVTEDKTKQKADFGGAFGEPVGAVLVCSILYLNIRYLCRRMYIGTICFIACVMNSPHC